MWGRSKRTGSAAKPASAKSEILEEPGRAPRLKEAMRSARLENAERSSVVVDLRDAELTRLEILSEALDPLFADIPAEIELFDRAISKGDTPRLWIDAVAHVMMGRDTRVYRFLLDTRYGRKILAESSDANEIVDAVTRYVARRMIERERALADAPMPGSIEGPARRSGWRTFRRVLWWTVGIFAALYIAVWYLANY
ncbi:MAG: hypothetical protein JWN71_708 [Xanthobacteraceae bacterium]|jgi:hypothetical protein|nr:hypothetical protein [Xanthobacteraceae bacterium]